MEILNFKGPLSDLIYILKKGGSIHIKKKNRGKFTDYCGGKVTEECIAKGKKSKDPKIRKRATFAANARKWKHENGGIIKYQNPNSPLFNPHKIIENVPAREWGPRKINEDGTITEGNGTKFSRAPFQYWGNKGLGSQNEKLARDLVSEFDQMRSENPDYNYILDKNYQSYDDAINYLNHLEGLKKYLQIPYDTGLLMESEYKPTRLQGTNEKTYKFKSSTVPGYWDDVVDDMVIGEHDKNQYYDQSLNEFTAYRDRDEKGDFVSIYDEWDYNPAVRGGNKKLNKVVDSVTGGKPFVIYDRIYLDDHYDVPEEARGNPFITPAVVTANAKHENGGILKAQNGTPYGLHGGVPSYMQVQPLSPVGIALNQAKATAKSKANQPHLPPGVKEVVGPDGKKIAIRTEQPLVPLEQSIAEWLPGTGDVAEVGYITNDVKNGNLGSAALAAGLMVLPGNARKILDKFGVDLGDISTFKRLSDQEWDDMYFQAIDSGDMDLVQTIRDAHFKVKAPNTKAIDSDGNPIRLFHGEKDSPSYHDLRYLNSGPDRNGLCVYYSSNSKDIARTYAQHKGGPTGQVREVYYNIENPNTVDAGGRSFQTVLIEEGTNGAKTGVSTDKLVNRTYWEKTPEGYRKKSDKDGLIIQNVEDHAPGWTGSSEDAIADNYVTWNPHAVKSAEAVVRHPQTGEIIPISKRDNFKIPSILMGTVPIVFGLNALSNNKNNQE